MVLVTFANRERAARTLSHASLVVFMSLLANGERLVMSAFAHVGGMQVQFGERGGCGRERGGVNFANGGVKSVNGGGRMVHAIVANGGWMLVHSRKLGMGCSDQFRERGVGCS